MIAKPSKLAKAIAKWEASKTRAAEKQKAKRLHDEQWSKVSAAVCVRDKQTCRVCACQTTRWGKGDPRTWGQAHHRIYRSAGGTDDMGNLLWVCYACHTAIHEHKIEVPA